MSIHITLDAREYFALPQALFDAVMNELDPTSQLYEDLAEAAPRGWSIPT